MTLVAWGAMVDVCERAAEAVEGEASIEVLDLRTLKPLDEEGLLASVRRTSRCVVVQEAPRTCGFASEVAALLAERAILDLHGPVLRVTGFDVPYPYWQLEDGTCLPSSASSTRHGGCSPSTTWKRRVGCAHPPRGTGDLRGSARAPRK